MTTSHFKVCIFIYFFLNTKDGDFILCQNPNDYIYMENAVNHEINPYYPSTSRQYAYSNPHVDIGATATLLVGGAALLGAIGIVGIASMQGYRSFDDKTGHYWKTDDCCKDLEHKLRELQKDFKDEKEAQDQLENRQTSLCNLANQLNQINIGQANTIATANPGMTAFNDLVGVVNTIIGDLNLLPNGACSNIG